MVPKICAFPECARPVHAKGHCKSHYFHLLKGRELKPLGRQALTLEQRFWQKVDKTADCWNWTAALGAEGYGRFGVGKSVKLAHRIAFELTGGDIPSGMELDHRCHNRACVNPSHLRVVNAQKNRENHSGAQSNSKTGIRGVYWVSDKRKWGASVNQKGRKYHVGYFDSIQDAAAAVLARRNELFTHNDFDRRKPWASHQVFTTASHPRNTTATKH